MIFAVAVVALVTAVNDSQKEKQFADLNKSAEQKNIVNLLKFISAIGGMQKKWQVGVEA
jgi:hypothetical protein